MAGQIFYCINYSLWSIISIDLNSVFVYRSGGGGRVFIVELV